MRCSRSQVVNGNRRSASAGASPTSKHHETEIAGLQHERERADGLLHRALIHVAAQAGIGHDVSANPEQAIEIDASGRGRARRRACRAHRRARRVRLARSRPPSCAAARSSGLTIEGRPVPTTDRAGTRRRAVRPMREYLSAPIEYSSRGSIGGSDVVSVRSNDGQPGRQ